MPTITLSPELRARVVRALAETQRFIDLESPRDASLRPASVQKTLDHAIAHKAKLEAALATGVLESKFGAGQ